MPESTDFLPALRYHFLTRFYDLFVEATLPTRRLRSELVQAVGLAPGHRVLDVGCGTGALAISLKRAAPGATILGLDPDRAILAIAASKRNELGFAIHLGQGLASALPYADASFDRVVSTLVFHHLSRDAKRVAFAEIRRVLRATGELHLLDFGRPSNGLMTIVSWLVGFFEDRNAIRDNFAGSLPSLIEEAKFSNVAESASFNTVFGTLRLYRATP